MHNHFYALADRLTEGLKANEVLTLYYSAEESDFVRFNNAKIRQAGRVAQASVDLNLISGKKRISSSVPMTGDQTADWEMLVRHLEEERQRLSAAPEDPYLLYATSPKSSEAITKSGLYAASDMVDHILMAAQGLDFVGIFAQGELHRGFANSLGQRNFFSTSNYNVDFCLYTGGDKAIKLNDAGLIFNKETFREKIDNAREALPILKQTPKVLSPGKYRTYLTPSALHEVMSLLSWNAFGLKAQKTKQSALDRMVDGNAALHEAVHLAEHTGAGFAPNFQEEGFVKPDRIELVRAGNMVGSLVSPRTAGEYDVPTNGASEEESPQSLDMAAGNLPTHAVLKELGTGLYINNLWYLNFSDRPNGRMTGMTRFATWWVENGRIVAPVSVMRFDESIYNMLGDKLIALTSERETLIDASTYEERSTASMCLPGALIEDFSLTL
jgi:predicted Zn-dependent protease